MESKQNENSEADPQDDVGLVSLHETLQISTQKGSISHEQNIIRKELVIQFINQVQTKSALHYCYNIHLIQVEMLA